LTDQAHEKPTNITPPRRTNGTQELPPMNKMSNPTTRATVIAAITALAARLTSGEALCSGALITWESARATKKGTVRCARLEETSRLELFPIQA